MHKKLLGCLTEIEKKKQFLSMNNAKTRVQTDFEEAFRFNCGNEQKSESIFAFHCSRMNRFFVVFLLQKCVKISSKCERKT